MEHHDSGSTLASSFTDMMTSLAVIFILLLVASLNNAQQGAPDIAKAILARLAKELEAFSTEGVKVTLDPRDPLALLVIVPQGLLNFEFDKSTIPAHGRDFLKRFVPRLAHTLTEKGIEEEISSVVVEGHTDSVGSDEHNVHLSQERSLAVVMESLNVLETERDNRSKFLGLLSATGRGKADPIRRADGSEDAELSRRVVFKIRVRSLEQKTLTEILGVKAPNASR